MMSSKKAEFKLPRIDKVKTASAAEDLAIAWQQWVGNMPFTESLSYGETVYYQNYFEELAKKFNLTEVFKENAII